MKCRVCGTDMEIGEAIHPQYEDYARHIAPQNRTLKCSEVRVIYCAKCPKCGESEYLDASDMSSGGIRVKLDSHA